MNERPLLEIPDKDGNGLKCDKCGFDEDAHIKHEQVKDAEIEKGKLTFKVSDEAYKMLEDSQAMALSAFSAGWKCHTPCGDPEQSFDYWWQGILKANGMDTFRELPRAKADNELAIRMSPRG